MTEWECLRCGRGRPDVEPYRVPKRRKSKCRECVLAEKRQQNWLMGFSERNILYAPREPALIGTSWDENLSNRMLKAKI